jgi:hypothetical protein
VAQAAGWCKYADWVRSHTNAEALCVGCTSMYSMQRRPGRERLLLLLLRARAGKATAAATAAVRDNVVDMACSTK